MRIEQRNPRARAFALAATLLLTQLSCTASQTGGQNHAPDLEKALVQPGPTAATPPPAGEVQGFKSLLSGVAQGVGQAGEPKAGRAGRQLVVFEEKHTSVASQFEIALMLLRLHERHGLRDIVLEGLTTDKKFPDMQWYRALGGDEDAEARNEVLVGRLRDGEISGVELIAAAFPDVVVHAADDPVAYGVELAKGAGSASVIYLFKIALKSVRPEHYARINELNRQHKIKEMAEYVISLDPWTKERYVRMEKSDGGHSIEEILREFREVEERARTVGAEITDEERRDMAAAKAFFEAADKRSATMVDVATRIEPKNPLVALNIGAAHTEGMRRLLDQSGATYAVVTPLSHAEKKSAGDISYESFERKGQSRSVAWTGKGLGSLLDGRKKPPPVGGDDWFKGDSQLRVAVVLLVRSFVDKGSLDPAVKKRVDDTFPYLRVDWPSLVFTDGELTFKSSVRGRKGWTDIYTRAGRPKSLPVADRRQRLTLEQMLLRELEGVRKEPGERKEPEMSPAVELITPDVRAVFATSSEPLKGVRVSS